jgi:hypothetical protein
MLRTKLLTIALLVSLPATAQQENIFTTTDVPYEQLKAGFANPPAEARLRCYWLWLNSMVILTAGTNGRREVIWNQIIETDTIICRQLGMFFLRR